MSEALQDPALPPRGAVGLSDSGQEAGEQRPPLPARVPDMPQPKLARRILLVVITAYAILGGLDIGLSNPRLEDAFPMLICLAGVFSLQLVHTLAPTEAWSLHRRALSLTSQAVLTYLPFAAFHQAWGGMAGFLAGSCLLLLRGRAAWIGFAVPVAVQPVIEHVTYHDSPIWAVYYLIATFDTGLVVYGMTRLSETVTELYVMRQELARLAVTRERLRFARDLHDLLGYSLSAITLRSELAKRLLPDQPERARGELDEILTVSRKALADVRAVARGYHDLSLADEAASARTMLEAAGIRTMIQMAGLEQLPTALDTALATTLREGVTNILRHSKVQTCTMTIQVTAGIATLELVNDGAHPIVADTPAPHGNGLDNLAARLAAVGGTLTAETLPTAGSFRLTAQAPADPAGSGGAVTSEARQELATTSPPQLPDIPQPKPAGQILLAVITAYAVLGGLDIALGNPRLEYEIPMLVCMAGVYALQMVHTLTAAEVWSARRKALSLTSQAILTYLPFVAFHQIWGGMAGFLAGSFLLLLRKREARIGFAAIVGIQPVIEYFAYHGSLEWAGYYLGGTLVTGLFTYGMTRLSGFVAELFAIRRELAELAVAGERLRFARDLHDLLGYSLSAITLRSELAKRLLPDQPERARGELDEILTVSRKALADVRAVARGYRQPSLADEAASARTMLEAAGIRTMIQMAGLEQLPTALDTALATTLREGVTNILRHSKVQTCTMTIQVTAGIATLELVNDGAHPIVADTPAPHGNGLDNLAARLAAVGGTLTAETLPTAGSFRLTAQAPLTQPSGSSPGARPAPTRPLESGT